MRRPPLRSARARRPAAAVGAIACWLLLVVHAVAAFDVVFRQRIGPVVAVINDGAGQGVHSGDMLVLPIAVSAMVCVIAGVACLATMLRTQPALPWRHATA